MSLRRAHTSFRSAAAGRLAAVLLPLVVIADAEAVVRCVDSDIQIQSTLDAAVASANTVEEVRFKTGNFLFSAGDTGYFGVLLGTGKTLTISGGWSGPPGQCNVQDGDPTSTVFWGEGERRVFGFSAAASFSGTLAFENLTIGGGFASASSSQSCLGVGEQQGALLATRIDRVRIESCRTAVGADSTAVTVISRSILVRNSLFAGNDSALAIPVGLFVRGGTGFVLNNTFVDNTSAQPDGHAAVNVSAGDGGTITLANNLFDRNVATASARRDIRVATNVTLRNNRYTGRLGLPVEETGSTTGAAGFAANDYFLAKSSTARDAGVAFAPALQGNLDLANQPRVQRGVVDLGALEYSSVFDDGFESP